MSNVFVKTVISFFRSCRSHGCGRSVLALLALFVCVSGNADTAYEHDKNISVSEHEHPEYSHRDANQHAEHVTSLQLVSMVEALRVSSVESLGNIELQAKEVEDEFTLDASDMLDVQAIEQDIHHNSLLVHNPEKYEDILRVLTKHWRKTKQDPAYLADDIESMAKYISARPEAYKLVMSLKKHAWRLQYQGGTFRSEVKGSRLRVNFVKVLFDTRTAAIFHDDPICQQVPSHCAINPADALLHELLHVKLALLETKEFLQDGGMNGLFYPHKHEQKVIALERKLYQAMSAVDQQPRPQRAKHVGVLASVECVTCLANNQ